MVAIEAQNAKGEDLKYGWNQFTDLNQEEYKVAAGLGYKPSAKKWADMPHLGVHEYQGEELAASVDWTTKGAVTPVKDQGQCGSCWTFSTTGAIEGAWEIATGSLVSLSEQQITSCASSAGYGCSGGWPYRAMQWAESQDLCTEASYPYTSGGGDSGSCEASGCQVGVPRGAVTGYRTVAYGTEALMQAVVQQPISILVDGGSRVFQTYSGGILQADCGDSQDHAVLLVGYGSQNGVDYWKVKNSWGSSYGESGYWRLIRGDNHNECGLLSGATYPVVQASTETV